MMELEIAMPADAASEGRHNAPARSRQSELGQFFTQAAIAGFMANMFPPSESRVRLLDAGAGEGALTAAYIDRWRGEHLIAADAYEIDQAVIPRLTDQLARLADVPGVETRNAGTDFLEAASKMVMLERGARYDRAILNPPYRKIGTGSRERQLIAAAGLETVNLYSGFVGLALQLMEPGGHLVAIIPRSFCNGPYYRPFRRLILRKAALRGLHLFGSRKDAFSRDGVLQENVIIHLERGGKQGDVNVSTSTSATFADLITRRLPFASLVADDDEQVISIPTGAAPIEGIERKFTHLLNDLAIDVSTGPVVDFRLREHLRVMPETGDVPLLYPTHLRSDGVRWPLPGGKKPNAIARNAVTERWLFPCGWYVLVKRFSSKEERRRVVATALDPSCVPCEVIGLENHLNVLHQGKRPMQELLARGLATYLNSTEVDKDFRVFSGHTQVNASDLKRMKFPTTKVLEAIGRRSKACQPTSQDEIDLCVAKGEIDATTGGC